MTPSAPVREDGCHDKKLSTDVILSSRWYNLNSGMVNLKNWKLWLGEDGIVWNENIDLASDELYYNGINV
jgi:hypothetical protein